MARQLRALARTTFIAGGVALVGTAVAIALMSRSELPSVVALLSGILLIVFGSIGELPDEVSHRGVVFGPRHDAARDYREGLYDAVRQALPELRPPRRAPDWHPDQPTYWVDELDLRIMVTWAPDASYRIDVSVVDELVQRSEPDVGVLLITNIDEIDDLQAAVRAAVGTRGAVVRWRSPLDTQQLRRTARGLHTGPDGGDRTRAP
jgi:hypothetical protein